MNATSIQLPSETDARSVMDALQKGFDEIEAIAVELGELEKLDGTSEDDPAVTLEDLAALATIQSDLRHYVTAFEGFADRIESGITAAIAIRGEQQGRLRAEEIERRTLEILREQS